MSDSSKETEFGRLYFSDKTINYLKRKSRAAIEKYHNVSVLYFGIDWGKSKKSFYGDITHKVFIDPKGIPIKGVIKITQSDEAKNNGIPGRTLQLTVSVFTEHLNELNIDPQQGDYFFIGKRYYKIFSRSISDVGIGSVLYNREQMRRDFICYEEDEEDTIKNIFENAKNSDINPQNDLI